MDISRLPLDDIEETESGLRIGTNVRNSDLAADPLVRRGWPGVSRALLSGPDGQRRIPIGDLHTLPGDRPDVETTLAHGELITAVDLPASPLARRSTYYELGRMARDLQQRTPEDMLEAMVRAAVNLIPGVEDGAISIVLGRKTVMAQAATSDLPSRADAIQMEEREGPSLDAVYEETTVRVPDMRTGLRRITSGSPLPRGDRHPGHHRTGQGHPHGAVQDHLAAGVPAPQPREQHHQREARRSGGAPRVHRRTAHATRMRRPRGSADAVSADRLVPFFARQLGDVVDQEALHTGELVALLRQHPYGELFA